MCLLKVIENVFTRNCSKCLQGELMIGLLVLNPDLDALGLPVAYWCFESDTAGEISGKI